MPRPRVRALDGAADRAHDRRDVLVLLLQPRRRGLAQRRAHEQAREPRRAVAPEVGRLRRGEIRAQQRDRGRRIDDERHERHRRRPSVRGPRELRARRPAAASHARWHRCVGRRVARRVARRERVRVGGRVVGNRVGRVGVEREHALRHIRPQPLVARQQRRRAGDRVALPVAAVAARTLEHAPLAVVAAAHGEALLHAVRDEPLLHHHEHVAAVRRRRCDCRPRRVGRRVGRRVDRVRHDTAGERARDAERDGGVVRVTRRREHRARHDAQHRARRRVHRQAIRVVLLQQRPEPPRLDGRVGDRAAAEPRQQPVVVHEQPLVVPRRVRQGEVVRRERQRTAARALRVAIVGQRRSALERGSALVELAGVVRGRAGEQVAEQAVARPAALLARRRLQRRLEPPRRERLAQPLLRRREPIRPRHRRARRLPHERRAAA
ncbi:proteophosphoglycan ppg4 [Gemmatirosa kalamazoonensis]|uniref:Proteophosphoglycan ppg4 n=1 Tax=Gemmatirosa kalamazoonensis TaxID=861299 RepID=W0RKA3_9BACT|nr:proteophosphoglycan ppg4 [Gemmatirosa kalamazoonensis]